ncbi:MAG TPA: amidohydrolase family protein [Nevskiaceae bacterium]|nr:amidohydrolase family protein [Nevskiaceae bacterium]
MRCAILLAALWMADAPAATLAIEHIHLVDATGAPARSGITVLVRDARIAQIAPDGHVQIPADAQRVDGTGRWLIPGLWDMHVHVLRPGRPDAYFPLLVAQGIVGVRDMGGDLPLAEVRRLKDAIARGARTGPQLVAAGRILDGPPMQLPQISTLVTDAASAQAAVQRAHDDGADFIKVYNRLSRPAYFSIATAARKLGLPVAGHVPFSVSAREASNAGQASIEHLFNILFACSSREDELMARKADTLGPGIAGERREQRRAYLRDVLDSYDAPRAQALFALFARNHTWQVPTLVQRRAFGEPDTWQADAQQLQYVPQTQRWRWDVQQDGRIANREAEDRELERRFYEKDREQIPPMLRVGVGFLAGTDAGDPYSVPGFSLHQELALLVDAGLTPLQALQAATREPARFLHREREQGTVETGKRADLVLLDADPLADIHNTSHIAGVVLDGRWLDRAALDVLLAQARAAAAAN